MCVGFALWWGWWGWWAVVQILLTLATRNAVIDIVNDVFALLKRTVPALFDPSPAMIQAELERSRGAVRSGNPTAAPSTPSHAPSGRLPDPSTAPRSGSHPTDGDDMSNDGGVEEAKGVEGGRVPPRLPAAAQIEASARSTSASSSPGGLGSFGSKQPRQWFNLLCFSFHKPQVNLYVD